MRTLAISALAPIPALMVLAAMLPGQKPAASAIAPAPTFDDEFDGAELNFPRWNPHDPFGHERNREAQAYTPSSIEVHDGMAHIVARREHARYDGREREFTSGEMTTLGSFAQTYGRFEIRCRVPAGRGIESRVSLLPVPTGELPSIDVLDVLGQEPGLPHFGNRWGDERTERSYSGSYAASDLSSEFHTFSMEWDTAKIVWRIDGKERFRSVTGVPHQPMYLAIAVAVGGAQAKYPDEKTEFPASLDIDYIRVYRD